MKKIEVICSTCGLTVLKSTSEYNRKVKAGKREFYCNNVCSGLAAKNVSRIKSIKRETAHLSKYTLNKLDEFSDFRWYMKVMKNSNRKHKTNDFDVDLEYLKTLWESQNGICPFSGQKMILRTHTNCVSESTNPYTASIDRINSEVGYIKGNIRFVSIMANWARNRFTDTQLIEFCKSVSNHNRGDSPTS